MKANVKKLCLAVLQMIPDTRLTNQLINHLHYFRVHKRFMPAEQLRDLNDYIFNLRNSPYSTNYGFFIDKEIVKPFISSVFGKEMIIPTLGIFKNIRTLATFNYPEPYVVKPTHMSQHILFKNGGPLSLQELKQCEKWLQYSYFAHTRQYNYRFLEPKIIIEPFIGNNDQIPTDFKFFIANGKCQLIQVNDGRFTNLIQDFYDPDWNKLDIQMKYPNSPNQLHSSPSLSQMREFAEKAGAFFEFVRVDLYLTDQGIKFGEYTFTPGLRITPESLGKAIYAQIKAAKQAY